MSKSLNKVTLIGNLGADPDVRTTTNGSRVATVSLATSRQWRGADGQRQEKTAWHRVICWNTKSGAGQQLADLVERYCKKGDKLYVEGEIDYRTWQDKEGQTRYSTEIVARDIILLSGRSDGGEGGNWSGSRSAGSASTAKAASSATKDESFNEVPEALDAEDDDLPF
jgi:single-strand DNA-binding protein